MSEARMLHGLETEMMPCMGGCGRMVHRADYCGGCARLESEMEQRFEQRRLDGRRDVFGSLPRLQGGVGRFEEPRSDDFVDRIAPLVVVGLGVGTFLLAAIGLVHVLHGLIHVSHLDVGPW